MTWNDNVILTTITIIITITITTTIIIITTIITYDAAGALCPVSRALCVAWGTASGQAIATALASAFVDPQNAGDTREPAKIKTENPFGSQFPVPLQPCSRNTSISSCRRAVRTTLTALLLFGF